MLNKKAVIEDWLPTILIIVILIFLSIFLLIPSNKEAQKKEIAKFKLEEIDSHQLLINFLNSPIEINGQNLNTAEVVVLYFAIKDVDIINKVKTNANNVFSSLDTEKSSWFLIFTQNFQDIKLESQRYIDEPTLRSRFGTKKETSEATIPTDIQEENIQVRLFLSRP